MTIAEITARIAELHRNNGAFYSIIAKTTPKLTAKNRTTKEKTDFVVQILTKLTCKLGVNYENIVNNRMEKAGLTPNFRADKPFGKHYICGSKYLMAKDTDESVHYLAVDSISVVERKYYKNGVEIAGEEVENVKMNYLPKPSTNEWGITWRTYGTDTILAIN